MRYLIAKRSFGCSSSYAVPPNSKAARVVSAVGAIGAAIVAWYAAAVAKRAAVAQQRVAIHVATSEWLRDLREWASEAIDALSEASYACDHHDANKGDCADQLRRCPDSYNQEIAKMICEAHESRAADQTLGGLLPDGQSIPTGATVSS